MRTKGVVRFSVSTSPNLLNEFDQITKKLGYDRSKAIQTAMRRYLSELKLKSGKGTAVGALVLLYDHKVSGLEKILTNIQHEYHHAIVSTLHIHLTKDVCLEIIAFRGELKIIHELSEKIMVQRGVMQLKIEAVSL